MAEPKQFRAIKGVRDILPPDSSLWNWFEATARRVFETYGFREIRLPIFEESGLFARSVGADTDIVSKEMYTFQDQPFPELDLLINLGPQNVPMVADLLPDQFSGAFERFKEAVVSGIVPSDESNIILVSRLEALHRNPPDSWQRFKAAGIEPIDFAAAMIIVALSRLLGYSLTLRPEATASVIRAYIEHGMHTLPGNVKLYYAGPMFRRERPQKGRYRQFYQLGAEVIGQSDHPAIDAELMEMLTVLLGECGILKWTLLINSIGCRDCRPAYVAKLKAALIEHINELKADSQRRVETNPLRVLDSKLPGEQPVIAQLPRITDHLCDACRAHFAQLQEQLKLRDIPYTVTPRLVRGLDYYMRTTFEITSPALGAQNALVGGGRYDGLSELLGGPPAKGMGFALGEDRFIDAIKDAGKVKADQPPGFRIDVFIAWMGGPGAAAAYPAAVKLARRLRAAGFSVELPPEEMKLKKSLGLADKLGARYALIIGENEVASGRFTLKRLADAQQVDLNESELVEHLRKAPSG